MSGKTISTGTLSLRFMQNAQRAKQLKETETEKASVRDDGQWEVDKEIREVWESMSSSSSQTISYETSYLPFLFPSVPMAGVSSESNTLKGRRAFNKHGEEETKKEEPELPASPPKVDQKVVSKELRVHPRPKSISSSSGHLFGFPQQKTKSKTAKEAIYDNTGVGVDLRRSKTLQGGSPKHMPNTFLKPSGVDDAPNARTVVTETTLNAQATETDIISGARQKKPKRQRSDMDQLDGDGIKRKKEKTSAR